MEREYRQNDKNIHRMSNKKKKVLMFVPSSVPLSFSVSVSLTFSDYI